MQSSTPARNAGAFGRARRTGVRLLALGATLAVLLAAFLVALRP